MKVRLKIRGVWRTIDHWEGGEAIWNTYSWRLRTLTSKNFDEGIWVSVAEVR